MDFDKLLKYEAVNTRRYRHLWMFGGYERYQNLTSILLAKKLRRKLKRYNSLLELDKEFGHLIERRK